MSCPKAGLCQMLIYTYGLPPLPNPTRYAFFIAASKRDRLKDSASSILLEKEASQQLLSVEVL